MKKIYIRNKGISIISKSGVFVEAESGNVYNPFDYEYKDTNNIVNEDRLNFDFF